MGCQMDNVVRWVENKGDLRELAAHGRCLLGDPEPRKTANGKANLPGRQFHDATTFDALRTKPHESNVERRHDEWQNGPKPEWHYGSNSFPPPFVARNTQAETTRNTRRKSLVGTISVNQKTMRCMGSSRFFATLRSDRPVWLSVDSPAEGCSRAPSRRLLRVWINATATVTRLESRYFLSG
jgi:hypothetical protein